MTGRPRGRWGLPGINFITGQQTVQHLGVRLGYDMRAACQQTFTGIYHAISARIRCAEPYIKMITLRSASR